MGPARERTARSLTCAICGWLGYDETAQEHLASAYHANEAIRRRKLRARWWR